MASSLLEDIPRPALVVILEYLDGSEKAALFCTSKWISELMKRSGEVTSLELFAYTKACYAVFIALVGENFLSLKTINLEYSDITDDDVGVLVDKFPNLERIDLSRTRITNFAVCVLADKLPGLKEVYIGQSDYVSDAGVEVLADKCPNLEKVSFPGCPLIRDATARALAKGCPNLNSANFTCTRISHVGVLLLAKNCKNLISLDVDFCVYVPRDLDWRNYRKFTILIF